MDTCLFSDVIKTKIHLDYLKAGKIICHPTNSCYGLGRDIMSEEGIKKIYALKRRDLNKPFNILVQDYKQFKEYGYFDNRIDEYIKRYPDKVFTFVVRRKSKLPGYINPTYDTIGIQVAKGVLKDLFFGYPNPLIATSANISKQHNCFDLDSLKSQFKKYLADIDLIIDKGLLPTGQPSIIVKIDNGLETILRGRL